MWSAVASFRPFLKYTSRTDLLDALALTRTRRLHEIIPLLDSDVERNAAIVLLSLITGLRACDMRSLRLADIDWRGGTIGIVQQKTGNPLTLPLPVNGLGRHRTEDGATYSPNARRSSIFTTHWSMTSFVATLTTKPAACVRQDDDQPRLAGCNLPPPRHCQPHDVILRIS